MVHRLDYRDLGLAGGGRVAAGDGGEGADEGERHCEENRYEAFHDFFLSHILFCGGVRCADGAGFRIKQQRPVLKFIRTGPETCGATLIHGE